MMRSENDIRHDIALVRYLDALEAEDFKTLEAIWKQAETDPELESHLVELNEELLLEKTSSKSEEPPIPLDKEQKRQKRLRELTAELSRTDLLSVNDKIEASYRGYRCRVLVVDDELQIRKVVTRYLQSEFEVSTAESAPQAREVMNERDIDILLTDQRLKGWPGAETSGVELLEWAREHKPKTLQLLMTSYDDLDDTIHAINRGRIFHYIHKSPERGWGNYLVESVRQAAQAFILQRKNEELLERLKDLNLELEEKVKHRTRELVDAMHELHEKKRMLETLALTDSLTGLPNRRAMDRLLERELLWRRRYRGPLALALVDIDHFKDVNERYLWSGGDKVLMDVARSLQASIREVDYLGRYGGEEFMLIAPQADVVGAQHLAERIRQRIEKTVIPYKGQDIPVTVSIGFAVAADGVPTALEPMRETCERALADAKNQGRNRFNVFAVPPLPEPRAQKTGG